MKLIVKWKKFFNQITDYIKEAKDILGVKKEYCSLKSSDAVLIVVNAWMNNCYRFLKSSFDSPDNMYAENFLFEKLYGLYKQENNKEQELAEMFQNLSLKKSSLENSLRLLSVSDAIIHPDLVDFKLRNKYNNNEIAELLFDKLYYLYDDRYYSIYDIINGNGLKIKDYTGFFALMQKYQADGYINLKISNRIYGQLTEKGMREEEKKRRFDFGDVSQNTTEILEPTLFDLFEKTETVELSYNFMVRELADIKLLNSLIFKNERNKLVVLMSREQIFYVNVK
jgi:hypothetical protein